MQTNGRLLVVDDDPSVRAMLLEYLHESGYVGFEVPKWLSLGLIVVIFAIALVWARLEGPAEVDPMAESAEEILKKQSGNAADRTE